MLLDILADAVSEAEMLANSSVVHWAAECRSTEYTSGGTEVPLAQAEHLLQLPSVAGISCSGQITVLFIFHLV